MDKTRNLDSQSEEIFALKSIYEENDFMAEDEHPHRGRIVTHVEIPDLFTVACYSSTESKNYVQYLPPITVFFELPVTYPSDTCPAFLLSCCWLELDQLSLLCEKLESMWKSGSGEVVLFQWINFLQNEVFDFLNITNTLDITNLSRYRFSPRSKFRAEDTREMLDTNGQLHKSKDIKCSNENFDSISAKQYSFTSSGRNGNNGDVPCVKSLTKSTLENVPSEPDVKISILNIKPSVSSGTGCFDSRAVLDLTNGVTLMPLLRKYDSHKRNEAFEHSWFTCEICYASKKGSDFVKLNKCGHMYCHECLKSYFELQIKEGNVNSLNCPDDSCETQADGTIVKEIVSKEMFQKYDMLMLSRTLEGMPDITYCPRLTCQSPLITDESNKMGCCPECGFVFCLFCRMAYHGIASCNLKIEEKRQIYSKYLNGTGIEKVELERRYGKHALKLLVENTRSEEWMESYSKQCPHCHASIEKNEGCNKMTCYKCSTYFCWLCLTLLNTANPYAHFSQTNSPCYNQLFPEDQIDFEPGEFVEY